MARNGCCAHNKNRRGKLSGFRRLAFLVAFVICICDLVALCLAFIAGMKFAEKKRRDREAEELAEPSVLGETTGLPVTDPKLADAEMDWDKDSGAV